MTAMLINGRPDTRIDASDRGLLYGDGLFETIAFHHGRSALWPLHMARLTDGCARLDLPMPEIELLVAECRQLVGRKTRAVVRVTLTRGSGGRAYVPPRTATPTRILMRREFPAGLEQLRTCGIGMVTSAIRLRAGVLAGLKHLNRLEQVLIGRECLDGDADEALVLDPDDALVEALTGNLVIVRGGELIAPGPHPAAVAGVGLAWLRQVASGRLEERPMGLHELRSDDAIWVINSVSGIRPVARLDGRDRPLGAGLADWQRRWAGDVESVEEF